MYKHLFFDDQRLYVRKGFRREYGRPEVVGTYIDPNLSSPYGWCYAMRGPDGRVHLLYNGILAADHPVHGYGIAESGDGVHFTPQKTGLEFAGNKWPLTNQILPPSEKTSEIASLLEDRDAPASERYKMLYANIQNRFFINDEVYSSPDLVHWKLLEGSCWNQQGTEPIPSFRQ